MPADPAAGVAAVHDLSLSSLVLSADPVVKGVMLLLLFASIACWSIILDRSVRIARAKRELRRLSALVAKGGGVPSGRARAESGIAVEVLAAGAAEWADTGGAYPETRGERRDRISRAMSGVIGAEMRRLEAGLSFLATVGSVAPFVGLLGTVWGIMNSFSAIAGSQDTSLAVVAPGIAEALFATALGLLAAIPAVVAYNRLGGALAKLAQNAGRAAAEHANRLAKTEPSEAAAAAD